LKSEDQNQSTAEVSSKYHDDDDDFYMVNADSIQIPTMRTDFTVKK
jgi:hypothetical protein